VVIIHQLENVANTADKRMPTHGLTDKERLDEVVNSIKVFLSQEDIRALNIRAVQAKVWHMVPAVPALMQSLREEEESLRLQILHRISHRLFDFHEHTLEVSLARAGWMVDARINMGSSLKGTHSFDLVCLDSEERLLLILKEYGTVYFIYLSLMHHIRKYVFNPDIFVLFMSVRLAH
jgi:hypothetical protein